MNLLLELNEPGESLNDADVADTRSKIHDVSTPEVALANAVLIQDILNNYHRTVSLISTLTIQAIHQTLDNSTTNPPLGVPNPAKYRKDDPFLDSKSLDLISSSSACENREQIHLPHPVLMPSQPNVTTTSLQISPKKKSVHIELHYHTDTLQLADHKLFAVPSHCVNDSRRVLIQDSPNGANSAQIIHYLARYGAIIRVTHLKRLNSSSSESDLLVEYADSTAIELLTTSVAEPIALASGDEDSFQLRLWIIPTVSYNLSYQMKNILAHGMTRTLLIRPLPKQMVWYFLSSVVHPRDVLSVSYNDDQQSLTIEMTSLLTSNKLFLYSLYKGYSIWNQLPDCVLVCEPIQDPVCSASQMGQSGLPKTMNAFYSEEFNSYWPDKSCSVNNVNVIQPQHDVGSAEHHHNHSTFNAGLQNTKQDSQSGDDNLESAHEIDGL